MLSLILWVFFRLELAKWVFVFLFQIGGLTIKCARVGGVEIPNNKRVEYSLQYIHGIGRTSAKQILNDLNMENKITKDLSEEELTTLRDEVSKYKIEGDLVSPLCIYMEYFQLIFGIEWVFVDFIFWI